MSCIDLNYPLYYWDLIYIILDRGSIRNSLSLAFKVAVRCASVDFTLWEMGIHHPSFILEIICIDWNFCSLFFLGQLFSEWYFLFLVHFTRGVKLRYSLLLACEIWIDILMACMILRQFSFYHQFCLKF